MSDNVCRAITFINFHIPMRWDNNISVQYCTIGFFDGMFTKRIDLNYQEDDLKPLWQYINSKTAENKGYYSYQNMFGFSRDSWNSIPDGKFWSKSTDGEYPLTFVVFLQVRDYMVGEHTIEGQCRAFSKAVERTLQNGGRAYTYGTVDKNDFIVCIKSRYYEKTVEAIKQLHDTGINVVYSYTIFSVNKDVLEELDEDKYDYLFDEEIPSICLKGITNSFNAGQTISLDRKYRQFCDALIQKLYREKSSDPQIAEDDDKRLYDILGDNDFRLIARKVSLGRILREYASGGILCYTENEFPYYLFSSSLVLNTMTGEQTGIDDSEIQRATSVMQKQFTCKMCDDLSNQMKGIMAVVNEESSAKGECVTAFCQAIFQLLQSLKALETAPTKKYDFYSLYLPLEALIHILESRIDDPGLENNQMIYEFVHKISMTLHGTLRTDIQFFQIRDFNVIVHYAPAKMRAFYALWAMKIKDFYGKFVLGNDTRLHEYSFILAPGMYKGTAVKQLFENNSESRHLMLITLPERHIYSPRWVAIILAHEVSHFVGSAVRNRVERHKTWLEVVARILELELQAFFYNKFLRITLTGVKDAYKNESCQLGQIREQLIGSEEKIRKTCWENNPNRYHSEQSIQIIGDSYKKLLEHYIGQILTDFCCNVRYFLFDHQNRVLINETEDEIRRCCNVVISDMITFCNSIGAQILEDILHLIKMVTAETFADMMAILTLELSPMEYVRSFVKTELKEGGGKTRTSKKITFINIRIAIVAETISRVFVDQPVSKTLFQNYEDWICDPIGNMKGMSVLSEDEQGVVEGVCNLLKERVQFTSHIDTYHPLYDMQVGSFKGKNADFLRDEKVFDLICDYLEKCAVIYIDKIANVENANACRKSILETYQNISKDSEIELMAEIERFLSEAEETYTPKNTC